MKMLITMPSLSLDVVPSDRDSGLLALRCGRRNVLFCLVRVSGHVYLSLRTRCALRYRTRCRALGTLILAWISLAEANWQAEL